jgi:TPR repeat protein
MRKNNFIVVGVLVLGLMTGLFCMGCSSAPEPKSTEEQVAMADNYWNNNEFDKALPLYLKVAELENSSIELKAYATFRVGRYYDRRKDTVKSVEWYTKAADLGNSVAQLNLGNLYHSQGEYKKSFELYLKSAEQGEPQAAYNVFAYYSQGMEGATEKDTTKALEWLEKAYVLGSEDAERVMRQFGFIE